MFIEKWATVSVHESMLLVRIVEIQAGQDTATTSLLVLCSIIVLNQIYTKYQIAFKISSFILLC